MRSRAARIQAARVRFRPLLYGTAGNGVSGVTSGSVGFAEARAPSLSRVCSIIAEASELSSALHARISTG